MKRCLTFLLITLVASCSSQPQRPSYVKPTMMPKPSIVSAGMSVEERLAVIDRLKAEPVPTFKMGYGDVLHISVYDEPDLTVDGIPVRPDGMISFPLIGDLMVVGSTAMDVRAAISNSLSEFLKDPKVTVLVRRYASQAYTIVGEVVKPGVFSLDTQVTLTQALAKSGGLTTGQFHASTVELADLGHAFISRKGDMLPIDFIALFQRGDLRYDLPLRSGDYIYIPSGLTEEIYVLGEVQRPDMFAFRQGMPLSKALVIAKGFTREADLSRVHIIRGSLVDPMLYIVDMNRVFTGTDPDVPLQAGDVIYLPPTGLARWADIVNKIIPGMVLARTGTQLSN